MTLKAAQAAQRKTTLDETLGLETVLLFKLVMDSQTQLSFVQQFSNDREKFGFRSPEDIAAFMQQIVTVVEAELNRRIPIPVLS